MSAKLAILGLGLLAATISLAPTAAADCSAPEIATNPPTSIIESAARELADCASSCGNVFTIVFEQYPATSYLDDCIP